MSVESFDEWVKENYEGKEMSDSPNGIGGE